MLLCYWLFKLDHWINNSFLLIFFHISHLFCIGILKYISIYTKRSAVKFKKTHNEIFRKILAETKLCNSVVRRNMAVLFFVRNPFWTLNCCPTLRTLCKRPGILSAFSSQSRKVTACTLNCDLLCFALLVFSLFFFYISWVFFPRCNPARLLLTLRATNLAFYALRSVELVLCPCLYVCVCECTCFKIFPLLWSSPLVSLFVTVRIKYISLQPTPSHPFSAIHISGDRITNRIKIKYVLECAMNTERTTKVAVSAFTR